MAVVEIGGEDIPVQVTWNQNARRFILRLDASSGAARLTLPVHSDLDEAMGFLRRHEAWLISERRRMEAPLPIVVGTEIPFLGDLHRVVGDSARLRRVWLAAGQGPLPEIRVSGPADTAGGRVVRWLKAEAQSRLEAAVSVHAERLGTSASRVVVRDQKSRWGSCSVTGTLSFSWRLVMAPLPVLDYVAAHEVAHLREMNHGPRFWQLVRDSYGDHKAARHWLKAEGRRLHRYRV